MYVTNFLCTYNKHDIEDQNLMYQQQFLQAFGINESPINKGLDDSNYQKKCRNGIYKLLKGSGKPKFISLEAYLRSVIPVIDLNFSIISGFEF